MKIAPDGGGGGDDYPSFTLSSVRTTRFTVNAGDNPQLQAGVENNGSGGGSATVKWYFGSTKVAERTETLSGYESATFARRVDWDTMDAKGLVPGDYALKAKLTNTGETREYGTMHIKADEEPADDGGDVDGGTTSCPPGYYFDTGFQMCLPGDKEEVGSPDAPTDGDSGDESGTTAPDDPATLLPPNVPTLPPVGPLTGEQTTAAVAVGLVLIVVVR